MKFEIHCLLGEQGYKIVSEWSEKTGVPLSEMVRRGLKAIGVPLPEVRKRGYPRGSRKKTTEVVDAHGE